MRQSWTIGGIAKTTLVVICWVLVVVVVLFPISVILSTAFKTQVDTFNIPATWIPDPVVLRNVVDVWREVPSLPRWFTNSIVLGLGGTAFTMLLVVPAAYAISRVDFSGKNLMIFLLLLIQMFSPVIIIVPLYQILDKLNLINNIMGLVLVDSVFAAAFSSWLLSGFFEEIPKDLEKAAIMDGCSSGQILRSIFIPLATPGLVVTAIYIFIWIFNEFLFAFTFMSSNNMQMFVAGIYQMLSYNPNQNLNWNMIMMAGLQSILPVTLLFMAIRRYLVRGLMSGAVKM